MLQPLETIECRDAVLTEDGKVAEWPVADVIIGNPPFLGDKPMISVMGVEYTGALRHAFAGRILGGADLVTYWFEKARQAIEKRQATRAGLVGTQAIRKGASRRVIDAIAMGATRKCDVLPLAVWRYSGRDLLERGVVQGVVRRVSTNSADTPAAEVSGEVDELS